MKLIKKGNYFFGIVFLSALIISACSSNRFDVDVNDIEMDMKVNRLDSLLFTNHPDTVARHINDIISEFPEFSELYFHKIIKVGSPYSKDFYDLFTLFLSEYDIRMAYEYSLDKYSDFQPYRQEIQSAFRYYKYYFPNKQVPEIYLMMTGFNQSIVVADKTLAIGVDKFLGSNARFYDQLQVSKYKRIRMSPEIMPYEAVKGWLYTEFPFNDSIDNLVSNMVYHGKILYLMDALFPQTEDSIKIAYTKPEMAWSEKSEDDMWLYMMDKKILFENDMMLIRRFIADAPFTGPFGQQSPGRVGQWIGWQIVRSYMNKNKEVTIPELMRNDEYQKFYFNQVITHDKRKEKGSKENVRSQIKLLSSNEKQSQADAIFDEIENLPEFNDARTIMHYWSLPDEIPTHNCIKKWGAAKKILLPVIKGMDLLIKEYKGFENMQPDPRFNIPEPIGPVIADPAPDIIIIPGVAFDVNCNRLGRGKGFYDRFLAKHQLNAKLIGVCFEEQIVPEVPTEAHDFKLDMVFASYAKFNSSIS